MQVQASDLADFPGAPFVQKHVDAVVAKLERTLGWHVSPVKTETVKVRAVAGTELLLPSRNVASVSEVRRDGSVVGYFVLGTAKEAMLGGSWADGVYDVDLTHGYEAVPADLLGEVARACVQFRTDPTLAAWSSGPFSASLRAPGQASGPSATFYAYSANTGV